MRDETSPIHLTVNQKIPTRRFCSDYYIVHSLLTTVYTRAGVELTDPQEGCKLEDIQHKSILRRTAMLSAGSRDDLCNGKGNDILRA